VLCLGQKQLCKLIQGARPHARTCACHKITAADVVQRWRACVYRQQDLTKLASIWHGHARTHGTQRGACPATDGWSQESRVRRCRSIHTARRVLAPIHHLHVPSTVHVTDTSVSYRRRRARTGWHQSKSLTCRVQMDLYMWGPGRAKKMLNTTVSIGEKS